VLVFPIRHCVARDMRQGLRRGGRPSLGELGGCASSAPLACVLTRQSGSGVPPQGSVVMRPCRLVVRGGPRRGGDGLDRAGVRAAVWRWVCAHGAGQDSAALPRASRRGRSGPRPWPACAPACAGSPAHPCVAVVLSDARMRRGASTGSLWGRLQRFSSAMRRGHAG